MNKHRVDFFASLTVCPSDIRKIQAHIDISDSPFAPLQNVLVTPLFANHDTLTMIRRLSENGSRVIFDSGGYYVQTGKMRYEEIYLPLLSSYKAHPWADIYALPDHVPTSQDTPEDVDRKVRDTITYSTIFFQELPDQLRPRAMPIVQGHTLRQVENCLEAYIGLGVKYIGFGSFGTTGKRSEINVATNGAVLLARHVVDVAHAHGIKVHLFGLGAPALLAMIKGIKADSFDSSTWLKAAGFGQVFLPFMRAYNISHRSVKSEIQQSVSFSRFDELRLVTGHHCSFCKPVHRLQEKKMYRAVHNLVALAETVAMVNAEEHKAIEQIYAIGSSRYRGEYEKWLRQN